MLALFNAISLGAGIRPLAPLATQCRPFLTGLFRQWRDAAAPTVYPPAINSTQNQIIMPYVQHTQEFYSYTNLKGPLIVNFTYASEPANKFTRLLFDVVTDSSRYPPQAPHVTVVSVWADTDAGRELMLNYAMGPEVPALMLLQKQMVNARYAPAPDAGEAELCAWLRSID